MQSFRNIFSFANEAGWIISGMCLIGYCGIRGWFGWLPVFLAVGIIMGAIAVAWMLAQPLQQSEEESFYEQPQNKGFDKFMIYLGLFIWGAAIFVYFGSLL